MPCVWSRLCEFFLTPQTLVTLRRLSRRPWWACCGAPARATSSTTGAAATLALSAQTDCPPVPRSPSPCKSLASGCSEPAEAAVRLHHMAMRVDVIHQHQMLKVFMIKSENFIGFFRFSSLECHGGSRWCRSLPSGRRFLEGKPKT